VIIVSCIYLSSYPAKSKRNGKARVVRFIPIYTKKSNEFQFQYMMNTAFDVHFMPS